MYETQITISNAGIGYFLKKSKKVLLKNINLTAEKGENIALIGINGSGKSTLLRSIANTQKLLSGKIKINNLEIDKYTPVDLAKKLAIVSSEIINTRFLKVKDLVSLGRFPHQSFSQKQTNDDIQIIKDALTITGAIHLAEKNINEISDGERQKVMIARALAQNSDIILLDEPTAFLDIENKYSVYNILSKTAKEQNKTIIFSTHDLNIALKHADKVWLIKDKTIFEGAPEDLILEDVFNHFFKSKEVNFNKLTNEFSVNFPKKYPIKVIDNLNSSLFNHLTESALCRNLFYISKEENLPEIIINENKTWSLIINNKKYTFKTIYEMMRKLYYLIEK